MVTQRERLKGRGLVQLSVWLPDSTVERMKALALVRELSMPKLVESALLALEQSPDEPALSAVPVPAPDTLANMRAALAELNRRVSLLENGARTVLNGAKSDAAANALSTPYLEESGAETADSAAVVALESPAVLAVPNVDMVKEKPELAALIATIPKADFVAGGNEKRNRRILELHLEGMGTTQISRVLIDEGIPNSKEASVTWFLKKNQITPNKINRRSK